MAKLVNLTPHPLRIRRGDGSFLELPKPEAGIPIPRLAVSRETMGEVEGCRVVKSTLGIPEGLPDPKDGVTIVVARLIVDACPDRDDLVAPGEAIRDADGKIVGADGFSR